MTSYNWAMTGIILNNVVWFVLCVGWGWLRHKDGWNDHKEHEQNRASERKLRADRRAQAADRARQRGELAPWERPALPRGGLVVMTSGERAPVTVVPVGEARIPMLPQPSRISGAGTVAMRAVTTTGEMRKLTDEFIEGLAARAAADRQEITS